MNLENGSIADWMASSSSGARHILLIDPDKQEPDIAAQRAMVAVDLGSSMIFVGGSTDTPFKKVEATCAAIQELFELRIFAESQKPDGDEQKWNVPVVLFPSGANALATSADGITFMMLMNSEDPRFLIGEQAAGAPLIRKFGIEPISMGYIVCEPGGKVGEVGSALLIKEGEEERVAQYVAAGEMYGFKSIYLEAGSGADKPVSTTLINAAREHCNLPLIVGGGIRTKDDAMKAIQAGADFIVTGTLAEETSGVEELQQALGPIVETCS
jgi:phosphoglycerol geranylgeranyltransferase